MAGNSQYVVLPLTGAGGRVSVMNHQKGGRLADGVIPAFLCGATVLDFAFNPFDETALFTGERGVIDWLFENSFMYFNNYYYQNRKIGRSIYATTLIIIIIKIEK